MSEHVVGIDPGIAGTLALVSRAGDLIEVADMPILRDGSGGRASVNAPLRADLLAQWHAQEIKRGRSLRQATDVHEVIFAPRRRHSRKPNEFYRRVERYSPGPRLDLFGSESIDGWTIYGNEAGKFDAAIPWLEAAE